ncbi:MAG: tRNA glutamyl-Q(34) synthetase GluQRS [Opitutae bacterium]|nr:tRNA glutamyl-Q(34) synthetase GluQRS [Opitutae bacterium]
MIYRGRLAPSPTGYLHLGHARTFWIAQQRALAAGGTLILRNDDLDAARCRPEFVTAMLADLAWFGLRWTEGPDVGGPCAPYDQSKRLAHYAAAFEGLRAAGAVYPCTCSRKDVQAAASAPHEVGPASAAPVSDRRRGSNIEPRRSETGATDEPHYPGTCRPENLPPEQRREREALMRRSPDEARVNWRFRVPDGETLTFADGHFGPQHLIAGRDISDFLVWRKDGTPSYQLACAVDDAAMRITEVVRGADLIVSTFRQLLLYRALGAPAPAFHHCPLVTDEHGVRLAKRHDALSLRALRAAGRTPEELRAAW